MKNTKELIKLVESMLKPLMTSHGVKEIFHDIADDKKLYPHIIHSFDRVQTLTDDREKRNISLIIDIYDNQRSTAVINDIADAVEELFDQKNLPQTDNLPTFYFQSKRPLPDEDKKIKHIQFEFEIQNYERK